ncbi:MAG TPA: site-specific integrase [Nitrososphaeraceae archaeon]|nr:site-specific integrase [Nitrososphaeraceae archaeon]
MTNRNKTTAQLTDIQHHYEDGTSLDKYIRNIRVMNKRTAHEYYLRLISFQDYVINRHNTDTKNKTRNALDNIIATIKNGSEDVYEVLSGYVNHLQTNHNISTLTIKQRVVTVKNFFEYHDVDISPRRFKIKVKLPKTVRKNKEALSKEDIINILNACSNIRLKTYVMLLAATGMRATEALSVRNKDFDFNSNPAKLFVRGEYTKTRTDRTIFLTEEIKHQLNAWLNYKYRTRRVCYKNEQTGKTTTEIRTPEKKESDLIFSIYQDSETATLRSLYVEFCNSFGKTLDRMNRGDREEGSNGRRRQITLHSFRRFVKTTISDLGYSDFSEYFIGHNGSTYWRKKKSEKAELFKKIEPYLTFLNIHQLERQGADIQSKVEELEELNQSLRNRDKMKDDAIAQLSDQVMALTARMQEFERKQQPYE